MLLPYFYPTLTDSLPPICRHLPPCYSFQNTLFLLPASRQKYGRKKPEPVLPKRILHYIAQVVATKETNYRFAAASEVIGKGPCRDRGKRAGTPLCVHWVNDPMLRSFLTTFCFFACLWVDRQRSLWHVEHYPSPYAPKPDAP